MPSRAYINEQVQNLDREKAQHRLTQTSAATALAAGGVRLAPWAARRSARGLAHWKPRTNFEHKMKRRIQWAGTGSGQQRMERAAMTSAVTAGLVGGVSTLGFARQQKRNIEEKEKALNLVKAASSAGSLERDYVSKGDQEWREHVSSCAKSGHYTLKYGERFHNTMAAANTTAAATYAPGAVVLSRNLKPVPRTAAVAAGTAASALSGREAYKHYRTARRRGDKKRAIERRGRARAMGISDDVPASELESLVGKAFPGRSIIRPRKPYRSRVGTRVGGFYRRSGKTFYRRGG